MPARAGRGRARARVRRARREREGLLCGEAEARIGEEEAEGGEEGRRRETAVAKAGSGILEGGRGDIK